MVLLSTYIAIAALLACASAATSFLTVILDRPSKSGSQSDSGVLRLAIAVNGFCRTLLFFTLIFAYYGIGITTLFYPMGLALIIFLVSLVPVKKTVSK